MHIILLPLVFLCIEAESEPTVCLDEGVCFHGSWIKTSGQEFSSFQGIRYGKAPTGELRFRKPQPYKYDAGDHNVSELSSMVACTQVVWQTGNIIGQEDCLLLSVYVPKIFFERNIPKFPVMVWIHGGGLQWGSSDYNAAGPQHFVAREVVVVAVHYRLAVLGFLSMGTEMVPGNVGLRDQTLALKWVNETIAYFGGDPELVTIFGESGGATAVNLHIMSPLSNGLFQRAILQSLWARKPNSPEHALYYTNLLVRELGCHQEHDALSCMQGMQVADIITTANNIFPGRLIWLPVIDANFTLDCFLPGWPEQLLSSGEFSKDIEIMIGTNSDEGSILVNALYEWMSWEYYRTTFIENAPYDLFGVINASDYPDKLVNKTESVVEFYLGSTDNINIDNIQGLIDMFTDAWFMHSTYMTVKYMVEWNVTVYQYILTYEGQYSFTSTLGLGKFGVAHADDLMYLFEPLGSLPPLNEDDAFIMNIMVTAWTKFAANGEPTSPDLESSWVEQICSECLQSYWNISGPFPAMATSHEINERMEFWNSITIEQSDDGGMNNPVVTRAPTRLPTSTPTPTSECSSYFNNIDDMVFKGVGSDCRAEMDGSWSGGLTCDSPYIVCLPQENTPAVDGIGGEPYKSSSHRYSVEECFQECSHDQRCMGVEFIADLNSSRGDCNLIDVMSLEISSEVEGFTYDKNTLYNNLDHSVTGGDALCFAKDDDCYPYFEAEDLNDEMLKCYCPNNRKGYYTKKVTRTFESTRYCGDDDLVDTRIKKAQANRMFHLCENWCLFLTENPEAESWYWDPWNDCWREQYAGVGAHMSYCNRVIRNPNAIEMQFLNHRKNMFCQSPQPTQSPSNMVFAWYLADEQKSCDDTCKAENKVCGENLTASVDENNPNTGSYFAQAGVTCVLEEVGNVDWALPGYEVSSGICLMRNSTTEHTGCNWAIGVGYQRLCACA